MTAPARPRRSLRQPFRLPRLSKRQRGLWMFGLLLAASSLILAGCMLVPVLQGSWWIVLAIAALFGLAACSSSDEGSDLPLLTPVVSKLLGANTEGAGTSLAGGASLGGDANADLVIGAPDGQDLVNGNAGWGRAYVLLSPPAVGEANLADVSDATIGLVSTSTGGGYGLGTSVALVGDLDGDTYSELMVGAPNPGFEPSYGYGGSGGSDAYVMLGSAAPAGNIDVGVSANLERVAYYAGGGPKSFWRAQGIGDFDGDGTPDLLGADASGAGGVVIISGARTDGGTPPQNNLNADGGAANVTWSGFRLDGQTQTQLGQGVAALNWNGDAWSDVAVGAPMDGSFTSTVHVILGAANALEDGALEACAATGSINDIGTPGNFPTDCGTTNTGPWIAHPTGFKITNGSATGTGNEFGYSVAAGDVNGDGHTDLLIGSPEFDSFTFGAGINGRVYLLLGDGVTAEDVDLSTTPLPGGLKLVTIDSGSVNAAERFGASVAVADLDGDGLDEIVIGAPDAGPGLEGHVTVIKGRSDIGSSPSLDLSLLTYGPTVSYTGDTLTVQGTTSGEAAGSSLANAGDIDGDGREDLLIGAPVFGDGNGAVYVIRLQPE